MPREGQVELLVKLLRLWPGLQHLQHEHLLFQAVPAVVRQLRNLPAFTCLEFVSFGDEDGPHPLLSICKLQHLTRLSWQCGTAGMLGSKHVAAWVGLAAFTSLRSLGLELADAEQGMPSLQPVGVAKLPACMNQRIVAVVPAHVRFTLGWACIIKVLMFHCTCVAHCPMHGSP